jgi:hypothetical protein
MEALVDANRTVYFNSITKAEKKNITTELTKEILKKGEFLKAEGNKWRVVPFESARQKIAHAIQYRQRCVGQRTNELSVLQHSETMKRRNKSAKNRVEDRTFGGKRVSLFLPDCDGTNEKRNGSASLTESASSSDMSILYFESSDYPAVSGSRKIVPPQESTNIQFTDLEIPLPLQALLRSTSDFSFGDCSLFGHSVLVTGNETEFDIF